jgi:hypothetical protein
VNAGGIERPRYAPLPSPVARPWPTTVLWWWRYELGAAALLGLGLDLSSVRVLAGAAAGGAAILIIPPLRAAARQRLWCIITPHRLRRAFRQGWVQSRSGQLPAVLWTRPTHHGEQTTVWCPAGVTCTQLIACADLLAAACWATDAIVTPHPGYSHLATVYVLRRGRNDGPNDASGRPGGTASS